MKRTVKTVADLRSKHLGRQIRIPDLHQPGEDFDVKVTVTGTLDALQHASTWWGRAPSVWVRLRPKRADLDTPLPLTHPCYLVSEDPPPAPAPVAVGFDEMED